MASAAIATPLPVAESFQLPLIGTLVTTQEVGGWNAHWCGKHLGQDVSAASGTPVYAIAAGQVKFSLNIDGLGHAIHVQHMLADGTELTSVYYHLKRIGAGGIDLDVDSTVVKGQLLGYVTGVAADNGDGPHLHFAIKLGPYQAGLDSRTMKWFYPGYTTVYLLPPPDKTSRQCVQADLSHDEIVAEWELDPIGFVNANLDEDDNDENVLQPGPGEGKDIWTTSVYCYCPGGGGPGGGLDNDILRVGGWADQYYSLIEFDLATMPTFVDSAVLHLYCGAQYGGGTPMYLDRITEFWDWRTQGTGSDHLRLWWADRPAVTQWEQNPIITPIAGQWYTIDITDLYNSWQDGTHPNYGLQLRPVNFNSNNFNEFFSSDYLADPTFRPKLVVVPHIAPL